MMIIRYIVDPNTGKELILTILKILFVLNWMR